MSTLKQNFLLAFPYNIGLTAIAVGIFSRVGIFGSPPMLAGFAMALSSITVAGNSILLVLVSLDKELKSAIYHVGVFYIYSLLHLRHSLFQSISNLMRAYLDIIKNAFCIPIICR